MTAQPKDTSVHGSAVLVGADAVLIRGPSGAGKSRLAFDLILAGRAGQVPPVTLIGDDRVFLEPSGGVLRVRGAPELAGLIEIRGLGLRTLPHASHGVVALVVDLAATDAERLPPPSALRTNLHGVDIPRIPVAVGYCALPLVAGFLTTS